MDPLGSRVLDSIRCPHDCIVDNYSVESADFLDARDPLPISRHKETLAASARVRTRLRSRGPVSCLPYPSPYPSRVLPGIPAESFQTLARV